VFKWPVMMASFIFRMKDSGFLFRRHCPERSARTMLKRSMMVVSLSRVRAMVVVVWLVPMGVPRRVGRLFLWREPLARARRVHAADIVER
jgi:hypothetical protein